MTEMIVIKPDEFEDPDQRNYSISSYKGNLIAFDKLVRFANLDSVPIEKTPEFSKLQENGKTIVLKLAIRNFAATQRHSLMRCKTLQRRYNKCGVISRHITTRVFAIF